MNAARIAALTVAFSSVLPGCAAHAHGLRAERGSYELEVLINGAPARTFTHRSDTYVLGRLGERYTLRIHNRSSQRIEAVVSVDGRDVMDGKQADFSKRGYLVQPYSTLDIDGWRVSLEEAAAFRFSRVADSYAARTGSARNVGVIGLAVFSERWVPPPRPEPVVPYSHRDWDWEGSPPSAKSEAPAAGAPARSAPADALAESEAPRRMEKRAQDRPGLGTEYGEAVSSRVTEVPFERAHPSSPDAVLGLRYNDRDGLVAIGIPVDGWPRYSDAELRQSASPFPAEDRFARPPPGWRR